MALKAETSLFVGLTTATIVYGIYQGALPTLADVRTVEPNNTDLQSAEKTATWTAAAVVAGVSLLARDATVFIMGGTMLVALSWLHRYSDQVNPLTKRATHYGASRLGVPRETQAEAPELYAVSETPAAAVSNVF